MSNYVRAMEEDFGENTEVRDIDLSLNRSLEELLASYWEAVDGEIDNSQWGSFYALEDYLSNFGAI